MGKSQQPDGGQTRHKHILIVDDDPILGDLLLEALQEEEVYQAYHVLSGEMALNTLQTAVPALLLLDYHLPGMNGLELADWLWSWEEYEHIPILLLSADVPQIGKITRVGADQHGCLASPRSDVKRARATLLLQISIDGT